MALFACLLYYDPYYIAQVAYQLRLLSKKSYINLFYFVIANNNLEFNTKRSKAMGVTILITLNKSSCVLMKFRIQHCKLSSQLLYMLASVVVHRVAQKYIGQKYIEYIPQYIYLFIARKYLFIYLFIYYFFQKIHCQYWSEIQPISHL